MSKLLYALAAMVVAAGLLLVPGISEHKPGKSAEKSVSVPEQIPTDTTGRYSDTGSGVVSGTGPPGPTDTTDDYSDCISEIRSELERLTGKRLPLFSVKEVISSTASYLDPEYFRNFDPNEKNIMFSKNWWNDPHTLDHEIFPKYACKNLGKEKLKKNLEELYHNFTINGKPFVVFGDPEKVKTLKENIEKLKDVCTGSLDLLPEKEPTIVIISGSPSPYGRTHTDGYVIIIMNEKLALSPRESYTAINIIGHEDSHVTGFPSRLAEIYLKLIRGEKSIPSVDREIFVQTNWGLIPFCGPRVEVKYKNVTIGNRTGRVPVVETEIEGETTEEYLRRIGVDKLLAGDEEGFVNSVWEDLQRRFRYSNESIDEYSPPENITVDVTEDVEKLREDFPWILDSLKYINTTEEVK